MRYTSEFQNLEHEAFEIIRESLRGTKYPSSTMTAAVFVLKSLGYNTAHFAKERSDERAYHKAEDNDKLFELYYTKFMRGIDPWHASDEAGYITGGYDISAACTSRTCEHCNTPEQIALYKRYQIVLANNKHIPRWLSKLEDHCLLTEEYIQKLEGYAEGSSESKNS